MANESHRLLTAVTARTRRQTRTVPRRPRLLAAEPQVHARLRGRMPDPSIVQDRLAQLPWYHEIALLEKTPTPDLVSPTAAAPVALT